MLTYNCPAQCRMPAIHWPTWAPRAARDHGHSTPYLRIVCHIQSWIGPVCYQFSIFGRGMMNCLVGRNDDGLPSCISHRSVHGDGAQ
jgi:hypothetical protein